MSKDGILKYITTTYKIPESQAKLEFETAFDKGITSGDFHQEKGNLKTINFRC